MLVILGKTASGKDSVVNRLVTEYGFKKLITYTTRPMRNGEKNDIIYHYISEEEFKQKIESGFFAEWKSYKTMAGVWYYGSAKEDCASADDKTVIILTPDGYKDILDGYKDILDSSYDLKTIYIYANNNTIRKRLKNRGDKKEEVERRIQHDNDDFRGVQDLVDKIVYNNEGKNIDDVVGTIVNMCGRI